MSSWIERKYQHAERSPGVNMTAPAVRVTGRIESIVSGKTKSGKRRAGGKPRFTDDQVKAIIRERLIGKSTTRLAFENDVDERVVANWCEGVNRKHLLREVEKEMRRA